ncbi:hypothetical protein CsatB_007821 [Cannabis sativa]
MDLLILAVCCLLQVSELLESGKTMFKELSNEFEEQMITLVVPIIYSLLYNSIYNLNSCSAPTKIIVIIMNTLSLITIKKATYIYIHIFLLCRT